MSNFTPIDHKVFTNPVALNESIDSLREQLFNLELIREIQYILLKCSEYNQQQSRESEKIDRIELEEDQDGIAEFRCLNKKNKRLGNDKIFYFFNDDSFSFEILCKNSYSIRVNDGITENLYWLGHKELAACYESYLLTIGSSAAGAVTGAEKRAHTPQKRI